MKNKVFPISMTVLWGMTFATALHSLTLGICMGMTMGIAFGLFDSDNKDDQKKDQGRMYNVWVLSETITTAIYNGRGGADVVSGMASGFAIANLFFVAFGGIYSATGVILGKTLGAGDLEEARKEKTWLLSGSAVFGLLMMAFGFGTTLIVPVVFGRLSTSAVAICRNMVMLMALFMPVWVYMNTQQAVARAGGDTAMGAYADSLLTLFVMIPMVILLGRYTEVGPVWMYGCVKLIDLVKVAVFHVWLKKERWLKNLTGREALVRS